MQGRGPAGEMRALSSILFVERLLDAVQTAKNESDNFTDFSLYPHRGTSLSLARFAF